MPTACCCDAWPLHPLRTLLQLATSKGYTSKVYYVRHSGHSFTKQNKTETNKKPTCQAVLELSCQIPQNALGLFVCQCLYRLSSRTMAWLQGRARALAETVPIQSVKGGECGSHLGPPGTPGAEGEKEWRSIGVAIPPHRAMVPLPTFLLSWSKLLSSTSNRLAAGREKSVCKGSSACFYPGALPYKMLKSGGKNQRKGQRNECLSQAGRMTH